MIKLFDNCLLFSKIVSYKKMVNKTNIIITSIDKLLHYYVINKE